MGRAFFRAMPFLRAPKPNAVSIGYMKRVAKALSGGRALWVTTKMYVSFVKSKGDL